MVEKKKRIFTVVYLEATIGEDGIEFIEQEYQCYQKDHVYHSTNGGLHLLKDSVNKIEKPWFDGYTICGYFLKSFVEQGKHNMIQCLCNDIVSHYNDYEKLYLMLEKNVIGLEKGRSGKWYGKYRLREDDVSETET